MSYRSSSDDRRRPGSGLGDRLDRRDHQHERDRDRDRDRDTSRRYYEDDEYHRSHRDRDRDRHRRSDRDRDRENRDRDSYSRRGPRERDDRRPYGDRHDRDRYSSGSSRRPRSPTPPPMKRENKFTVEELEQAIPINQRSRRNKAWDVKPQGGESLTAEMAKMSGLFPLPMQQKKGVDLTKVQGVVGTNALAQLKGEPVNGKRLSGDSGWRFNALQSVDPYLLQPSRSRVSRRVIITTSSSDNQITHERLARHFNQLFRSIEGGPESVVFSYSTTEGKIHVLEFRTTEEATLVIALNELPIDETEADSPILMIRRPKDYFVPEKPPSQSEDDGPPKLPDEDKLSDNVEESLNKLALSNLPQGLLEEQVLELLTAFGELKSFKLIKDRVHDESIGVAFCEFKDPKVGDLACQGLNDVELIGKKVKMTRVCQGIIQPSTMVSAPINSVVSIANEKETYESLVIQMFNMVTAEELVDDIEFEEIMEQIATRVSKIGAIDDLKIPRPVTGSLGRDGVTDAQNPGVGKVYVKFKSTKDSRAALETFAGAKFTGRTIVTAYYPQENFDMDVF